MEKILADSQAVERMLARLAHEIIEKNPELSDIALIGILRRGAVLSDMLGAKISDFSEEKIKTGYLDITLYRDDLSHESESPVIHKADIGVDVNDKDVVLVDDVLYTGRTARAAIEAVFSVGRPRSIQFAVLVDRGHRELPIRADYVGNNVPTSRSELIEVRLPEYDGETGVYLMELD